MNFSSVEKTILNSDKMLAPTGIAGVIMVTVDEAISRRIVKAETGIDIVFKSDVLSPADFGALRPIDASLIDFELGKLAKIFVGLSRSTFANLATFERFALTYNDRGSAYVYNLPGDLCGQRTDLGRHNDPVLACA